MTYVTVRERLLFTMHRVYCSYAQNDQGERRNKHRRIFITANILSRPEGGASYKEKKQPSVA